jgi:alpha-mannosidase
MLWRGFAGSEMVVHRSAEGYNTLLGKVAEKIEPYLTEYGDVETSLVLWGVGNHGGGPSRDDLATIEALRAKYKGIEFVHSTPDAYFADVWKRRDALAETPDMNYIDKACFSSLIRVKQRHMALENELYVTEKMAAHAAISGWDAYPVEALAQAERDLLFNKFHDILPGSCIQSWEDGALRSFGHGMEALSRAKMATFMALAGGQPKAVLGEYPFLSTPLTPSATRRWSSASSCAQTRTGARRISGICDWTGMANPSLSRWRRKRAASRWIGASAWCFAWTWHLFP